VRLQGEVVLSDTDSKDLYIIDNTADFSDFPLAETPYRVASN
jgi:hypothetical protein